MYIYPFVYSQNIHLPVRLFTLQMHMPLQSTSICEVPILYILLIIPDYLYYNSEVCVCLSVCLCRFYLKTVNVNDLILFAT